MTMKEAALDVLRGGGWFARQPVELQTAVGDAGVLRRLPARSVVYRQGDAPNGLYGLVEGALHVSRHVAAGEEALLYTAQAGFWIGEVGALFHRPYEVTLTAAQPTVLLHLPQRNCDEILREHPDWELRFAEILLGHLLAAVDIVGELLRLGPISRVARRILMLCETGYGMHNQSGGPVRISQEELATMVGTSRKTLNRILAGMAASGLVEIAYARIQVLDVEGLRRLVDSDTAD